jgi:glyoxylase-like metal-dependent hydrolase (beta-lactamase superfamily II)
MPESTRRREVGRGERVLPGVWRLRLPLPWPGVPHGNAWALAAGDGIVLVDTGMHGPGSMGHLERALDQVGLKLEHVRLLVCTHAHADHYGQAATIMERTGCELWMHPDHEHMLASARDPDEAVERRIEVALRGGVPEAPVRAWAEQSRGRGSGIAEIVTPDRDLVPGVEIETDLGTWTVHETPGHAPSHVALHEAGRRVLISGDHVLGKVSPYYDIGYSPDPAGEFLRSLDEVDALDARLCLSGHGRTFTDVRAHVEANRTLVTERIARTEAVLAEREAPVTVFDAVPLIAGEAISPAMAVWWLSETAAYLLHLERAGRAERLPGATPTEPEHWVAKGL